MTFPEGFFFIRCKGAKMAVDVNGGSMNNETNIIIWPQKMTDSINQLWMHEDGFLINRKSGLVLDIKGGDLKKDKSIIQYARKHGLAHNQRWGFSPSDGTISPLTAPHLALDIRNGTDYKDASHLFLNVKNSKSRTQQWVIEPFKDDRSDRGLDLLKPPQERKQSEFPLPEELHDCYRQVYLERKIDPTDQEIAGAAAFQALKLFVRGQKQKQQPIVVPEARESLRSLALHETKQLLSACRGDAQDQDTSNLMRSAEQAAASYFAREYEH